LTAKNRETPNLFNLNFNQGLTLHSEASETKSNTDKARAMMNAQLHNQMASIAKQKFLRQKMEQFILQFNKRAEAGIQYLISSNLVIFSFCFLTIRLKILLKKLPIFF